MLFLLNKKTKQKKLFLHSQECASPLCDAMSYSSMYQNPAESLSQGKGRGALRLGPMTNMLISVKVHPIVHHRTNA